MAPRRWTTFSSCNFLTSNSLYIVDLLVSDKSVSSSFLCRNVMTDSRFVSFNFILPLLCFACGIDFERICIFIVSQRSTASTSVLFWYSFATSVIVVFIKLKTYLTSRTPGPWDWYCFQGGALSKNDLFCTLVKYQLL